jgi:hypothetical protein
MVDVVYVSYTFQFLSVKMVIKIKICEYQIDEWHITVVSLISLFLLRCLRISRVRLISCCL